MVKVYDKQTFDIGVKRTSGTTVGMMLRRNPNDVPAYQVFDDEYLSSQFFTGEPGYGSLPSEKEISILQNDWRSGFGLEVYDASDSKRYRASNGMDMRFRGMGLAGPIASTVTKPTANPAAPTIVNADMELTTGWTSGARSAVQAHGGTYSWVVVSGTTPAYQDVTGYIPGCAYTFACWVWADQVSTTRISLYDGVTRTYSSYHTGDSTWQQLTVASTAIGINGTQCRLELNNSNVAASYFDDATITSNTTMNIGVTTCHADFNDLLYVNFGTILAKQNGAGTAFTAVAYVSQIGSTITALEVMTISGTEYLFIALGTSENYLYMVAAETLTISTAVVNDFKYFKVVNAASPTMWGSDGNVTLRSTVNPLNGGTAWSGQTTVDAASNVITGLYSDAGLLYIPKEDMPYYLDSTGAVKSDLAPILSTLTRSTDNGKRANYWLGNFYLPWGQSLLEEDAGTLTWRSPNDYSTQLADFVGQVFAVAGDDHYLFIIVDNGAKIEVISARSESIDGVTRWAPHPINETTLTGCETCWVSAVYQKRLWISSTAAGDSLYYIPLPVAYGNVLADANRAFLTGTTMETSWLHGNFRSTIKSFIKLTLEMGHTYNANVYFTVKYKLLEDTAWTTIGNFTGSATSMIQSRYIPVDAESNNPKSTLFKLQFTAVTNDTTLTPVLLNYQLQAVLYPTQREIIAMKVYCANDILLRDGGQDLESYDVIIATLNEARTATYPVTIYDIDGAAQTGKFLPLPGGVPRWTTVSNEANRRAPEREYNLLFQIIPIA